MTERMCVRENSEQLLHAETDSCVETSISDTGQSLVCAANKVLEQVVTEIGGKAREGQIAMVRRVSKALENTEHLMVQAGTGTGKSFAYLIPALIYALRANEPVIVSTATLTLQHQIIASDAPLVAEQIRNIVGRRPKIALLKGWNNYACMRKVTGAVSEEDALLSRIDGESGLTAVGEEVLRAGSWALESDTGDRDELIPGVSERAWEQISVPKNECIGEKCPVRVACFPLKARNRALDADLVVTNHAMIGVEVSANPVLPKSDIFIIDEAHELVSKVTGQLSFSFNKFDLKSLARKMSRAALDDTVIAQTALELDTVMAGIGACRLEEIPADLAQVFVRLLGYMQQAAEDVRHLNADSEESAQIKQVLRARVTEVQELSRLILGDAVSSGRLVAWISLSDDGVPSFNAAPLDVASDIADKVFFGKTVVLTSATLKVGGTFDVMARNVGFMFPDQPAWEGVDVGSPFAPEKQGILYLPRHLPAPGRDGYGVRQLQEMVELIQAARGGALCLFTSYVAMRQAAQYFSEHLDFPILCQGDDPLPGLISRFAIDPAACLLGTLSLWQGVDVPGLTNRLVIMDRIPFPRPDDPLYAARVEAVEKRGGNGFMEVGATQAGLLLAQGAGRLLRRINDRGVVAVLDSRLTTKQYRHYLLRSMPRLWMTEDLRIVKESLRRLAKQV